MKEASLIVINAYENICLKFLNLKVCRYVHLLMNEYIEHNSIKYIANMHGNNTNFSLVFTLEIGKGRESRMEDLNYICTFCSSKKKICKEYGKMLRFINSTRWWVYKCLKYYFQLYLAYLKYFII